MKSILPFEKIKELLPQKDPFVMVKELLRYDKDEVLTRTTIDNENIFIENDVFNESGLLENFAQSIALHTSYGYFLRNEIAPIGYIGTINNVEIKRLPKVNETIFTSVKIIKEFMGITMVQGEITCHNEVILSAKMKTFIAN